MTTTDARKLHEDLLARADAAEPSARADMRAILELHSPCEADWKPGVWICDHCDSLCHSRSGLGCEEPHDAVYPCPTIRALAAPYPETPEILKP